MARIKLIVTGDMKKLALHESLSLFFPGDRDGEEVIWDTPRKAQGVTTHRLQPLSPDRCPSQPMLDLAKAMLTESLDGKKGIPADLVVAIDDVELGNLEQQAIVTEHFRAAINEAIKLRMHDANSEDRYLDILRQRCFFHLFKPMVESYLFGDANALRVAGVPSNVNPKLIHASDVEQFETNDPSWLPICRLENGRRKQATPWWCHERHPKHYLKYFADRGQVFYEEARHGKNALIQLDWKRVPKCPTDTLIIRSLFEDLSDWFGVPNPIQGLTHPVVYPPKTINRTNLRLRNL